MIAIDTLHASTFIVTVLTAMAWLPWLLVGVPAGAWIDRLPPRPVMLASDAISLTAYGSVPVAAWSGVLTVVSFMQTYVPPDILGRVSSATRAAGYAMMPAGALLAGALATALGIRGALWILTALIAASGLLYLLTPIRQLRDLPRRPARTPSP